jgi:hypothetical protein
LNRIRDEECWKEKNECNEINSIFCSHSRDVSRFLFDLTQAYSVTLHSTHTNISRPRTLGRSLFMWGSGLMNNTETELT